MVLVGVGGVDGFGGVGGVDSVGGVGGVSVVGGVSGVGGGGVGSFGVFCSLFCYCLLLFWCCFGIVLVLFWCCFGGVGGVMTTAVTTQHGTAGLS